MTLLYIIHILIFFVSNYIQDKFDHHLDDNTPDTNLAGIQMKYELSNIYPCTTSTMYN